MKKLTPRQQQILDYLLKFSHEKGYSPSIRELAKHFKIRSTQGIVRHLDALERKGYIKRDSVARSIRITTPPNPNTDYSFASHTTINPSNFTLLPLLGEVAAGQPILAIENTEDQIPIPNDWISSGKQHFVLKVKGESMADAILPGDLVIVAQQSYADIGDIVVAMIDEEATVKRFYKQDGKIILKADNPAYEDIPVSNETTILGKVVSLLRKY